MDGDFWESILETQTIKGHSEQFTGADLFDNGTRLLPTRRTLNPFYEHFHRCYFLRGLCRKWVSVLRKLSRLHRFAIVPVISSLYVLSSSLWLSPTSLPTICKSLQALLQTVEDRFPEPQAISSTSVRFGELSPFPCRSRGIIVLVKTWFTPFDSVDRMLLHNSVKLGGVFSLFRKSWMAGCFPYCFQGFQRLTTKLRGLPCNDLAFSGGWGGIRTLGTLRYTRSPGVPNRPLWHPSGTSLRY